MSSTPIAQISTAVKNCIDEKLRNHRFIHCKQPDVSYGLPFNIEPFIEQALRQYLVKLKPKVNLLKKIPFVEPPENKLVKRVQFKNFEIEYMSYIEYKRKNETVTTKQLKIIHHN